MKHSSVKTGKLSRRRAVLGAAFILHMTLFSATAAVQAAVVSSDARLIAAETAPADNTGEAAPSDGTASYENSYIRTEDGHLINPDRAISQKMEAVQTNEIEGWPKGPEITAKGAYLMDADTGTVLYAKNIHDRLYPASTTKLLTCLIAAQRLDLHDTVTMSYEAVSAVPYDGSNIGMDVGETITVEQALYGIMVGSANEVANAIAEKTAGSISAFADLMNETAASLGCTDSHFSNANGLFEEDHYTSAHDLALIAKAFFENETLLNIGNTPRYHFEATATQPDDFWLTNKHELITGGVSCPGVIGGKTGYTSQSGETLVTGCERAGRRLICVVMREDDPAQYLDTAALFDYGFSSFRTVSAAENDTDYAIRDAAFLTEGNDLLGTSAPGFYITDTGSVYLPVSASFSDLEGVVDENNTISYYFAGEVPVGSAQLNITRNTAREEEDDTGRLSELLSYVVSKGPSGTLYIGIFPVLAGIFLFNAVLCFILRTASVITSFNFGFVRHGRRRRRKRRRGYQDRYDDRRYHSRYDDFYDDGGY